MVNQDTAAFSASASPLPARRLMTERFGVIYADVRRFWMLPMMLAVVYAGWLALPHIMDINGDGRSAAVEAYLGFVGTIAFLLGLAATNDDKDRGTLWHLRALPITPLKFLLQKFAASVLLLTLFLCLSEVIYFLFQQYHVIERPLLVGMLGHYAYPAMWNFGVWWSLSLVTIVCLVLLGMAAGSMSRNFVTAALVGLGTYVAWNTGWTWGLRSLERTWERGFYLAMTGQLLILSSLSVLYFLRSVRFMDSPREWIGGDGKSKTASGPQALPGKIARLRLPWERTVTPYGTRFAVLALGMAVVGSVIAYVVNMDEGPLRELSLPEILLVVIPPLVIGVSVFSKEELSATTGMLYWQPVSRSKLLWARLPIALAWALVAALPGIYCAANYSEDFPWLIVPVIVIGATSLAALARLFYRHVVFPLILAFAVTAAWTSFHFQLLSIFIGGPSPTYPTGYVVWSCLIFIVLPLATLVVAYTKSELLNVGEGMRVGAGLAVVTSVAFAGILLLTALPGELVWLSVHWLTRLLGIEWGGEF